MFFDIEMLTPYIELILPLSFLIAIILLLTPLLSKKYVARTRYYIWLIIALRLILPFDINFGSQSNHIIYTNIPDYAFVNNNDFFNKTDYTDDYHQNEDVTATPDISTEIVYESEYKNNVHYTPNENLIVKKEGFLSLKDLFTSLFPIVRVSTIIANIWIYTAILLFLYHILQYFTARIELNRNSVYDKSVQDKINNICRELGIQKPLKVYRTSSINSAIIAGIIKPAIFIPDIDYKNDMLEMVLYHELVHYKRKDILYKFILMVSCCLHWYNPLVWLMDRQAQKDIEIACDEDVIKDKDENFVDSYSNSIISMLRVTQTNRFIFSTGFASNKETLIYRFKNIYDKKIKSKGKSVIAFVIALCIFSSALISCTPKEEEKFEIPQQAMELMEFMLVTYLESSIVPDILFTTNYNLNAMQGFNYLKYIGAPIDKYIETYKNQAGTEHYEFPFEKASEIYQFLLAIELDESWDKAPYMYSGSYILNYDYNAFTLNNIGLKYEVVSTDQVNENSFITVFSRTIEDVPYNNIWFKMEKQIIDYVPEDLKDFYNTGDEIWRIKDMGVMYFSLNPYPQTIEINSKEEFLAFVKDINSNGHLRQDNTYLLNTDIDLSGIDLSPIGRNEKPYYSNMISNSFDEGFNCIFDGQGHTISNLTIRYSEENGMYNGLFSIIGENGVVKNLNIENAFVAPTDNNTSAMKHGTGILAGKSIGYIENCTVNGSVNGIYLTGGLCGIIAGTVKDCTVNADVYGSSNTGGLSDSIENQSIIKNCSVNGTVNGVRNTDHHYDTPWHTGSFTGSIGYSTVENCHTSALLSLDSGGNRNGIFCGEYTSADIINCTFDKSITGVNKIIGHKWISADAPEKTIEITQK